MHRKPGLAFFLLAAAGLLAGPPCRATTVVPLSTEDLVANSPTIVHGTVTGTRSHWNDEHTMIVTDATIRVEAALRGRAAGMIVVTEPGGTVGALRTDVPGASGFRAGEELVLFARPDARGTLYPTGLDQGCFRVTADPKRSGKIVRGTAEFEGGRDRLTPRGAGAAPATAAVAPPDLDSFLTQIRGMVQRLDAKGGR